MVLNIYFDRGALVGGGGDREVGADGTGALFHALEPKTLLRVDVLEIKTMAVIVDGQRQCVGIFLECYLELVRTSM